MKYIRTKDGITTSHKATHELIEHICCAGYGKILKKGACVRIDKEWFNFYGRWVDLIDEDGHHYSIRPSEVEKVTKELPQADTIEELCDEFIIGKPFNKSFEITHNNTIIRGIKESIEKGYYKKAKMKKPIVYGAIWTKGEHEEPILKSVAKMNEEGELCLL